MLLRVQKNAEFLNEWIVVCHDFYNVRHMINTPLHTPTADYYYTYYDMNHKSYFVNKTNLDGPDDRTSGELVWSYFLFNSVFFTSTAQGKFAWNNILIYDRWIDIS